MMGLKHSKKMSEDEREKLFWHIINNKRMFQSLLEIFPYYFAWVMAAILLVNVNIDLIPFSLSKENFVYQYEARCKNELSF